MRPGSSASCRPGAGLRRSSSPRRPVSSPERVISTLPARESPVRVTRRREGSAQDARVPFHRVPQLQEPPTMKKIVLTFGLIAGAVLAGTMLATMPFHDAIGNDAGLLLGYTS